MTRLLVLAPNWLGDAVMALPAIADVRRAMPEATIAVAARRAIRPLFELVSGVDASIDIAQLSTRHRGTRHPSTDAPSTQPPSTGAPSTQHSSTGVPSTQHPSTRHSGTQHPAPVGSYDAALLLPNSFHAAMIAWRAGIAERWGYRSDWRAPLLTRPVRRPRGPLHQAAYYQRLVAALGFANGPCAPCVQIGDELRRTGRQMLIAAGWTEGTPPAAIAPGAAYGGAKRWPPENFAALTRALADEGMQTVMVGSDVDRETGHDIERRLGGRIVNLIGRTDLASLGGVLAHCRGLVTNDSGAMHFAAATGVSVAALFGPTNEHATRPMPGTEGPGKGRPSYQQPATSQVTILTHPVWCRPCMMRECPIDHRCMRGITVDEVVDSVRRMA